MTRTKSLDVHHGNVGSTTYTIERPKGSRALAGRLMILPGLLGTELAYAKTSTHIASSYPLEVVTMTHGRELGRLRAPMQARSKSCRAVLMAAMQRTSLPNYLLGHSLGGADTVHLTDYVGPLLISGFSLEASVGRSGSEPKVSDVIESMVGNVRGLPRDLVHDSVRYFTSNPALATAEAVHAKRSDIRQIAAGVGDLLVYEAYNGNDKVVTPPTSGEGFVVRKNYDHLAICTDPNIGLEHAEQFLERLETMHAA